MHHHIKCSRPRILASGIPASMTYRVRNINNYNLYLNNDKGKIIWELVKKTVTVKLTTLLNLALHRCNSLALSTLSLTPTEESTVQCGIRFTGPKNILDMLVKRKTPSEPETESQLSIVYPVFRHIRFAKNGYYLCHVCLYERMFLHKEQLGFHCMDFYEIGYLSIFLKSIQKIQVSLKLYKNNGYFPWRPIYMFNNILLSSS